VSLSGRPLLPRGRFADWLESGVVALTGRPDGPPLVPPGRAASVARELAAVLARAAGIDVDGAALLAERAAFTGGVRRGVVSVGGACRLLPTADGWAAVSYARPDDRQLLAALIGADLDGDVWEPVAAWLRERPGTELAERAALLGLPANPVSPGAGDHPVPAGTVRPAAGLRVVDFSALWAGPLCAHLLGLGGADVIKVETPDRPDGARAGHPGFYRLLHAGHRSVVLDPRTPRDRAALAALVSGADVVIEASRPRALAGWGLGPAMTTATWVSITAAGRASPRVGFGDDVAAGAGLVADDGSGPVFCGDALADPLTGLAAAAQALTSPPGTLLDVAMAAVVAGTLDGTASTVATRAAPPRTRTPPGPAPETGADTDAVLREL
jgi:crotonobetainyl-CoA:carnitine CoA-transferase CaiB-like acyl-CoA transferase